MSTATEQLNGDGSVSVISFGLSEEELQQLRERSEVSGIFCEGGSEGDLG
jgi:hypothetical protein